MLVSRIIVTSIASFTLTAFGATAFGQDFPTRTVRIVAAAGGGNISGRLIAQGISGPLGQSVIVENRPSGPTLSQAVIAAPPDGHMLLVTGGNFWISPLLQSVPYDPMRDVSPISLLTSSPNVLVVHASLPVKSVKELIAFAKARPGQLNYGSGASGSGNHLAAELFKSMAGVNIVRVSYKNSGQEVTELIAGEVELSFSNASVVIPHVKSGRLRGLAVTSLQPSALAPGLPTMSEAGLPGFEAGAVYAMFAPAKTPATTIIKLNRETVRVLNQSDVKEKLADAGLDSVASSPEELSATMKSDTVKLGKLIKDIGIKVE